MTDREALADLLEAIDLAIYSGDWKVDGACDPDAAIQRARGILAQPEQKPVAFICEFYADEGHPFVSFEPVTHGTNTPLYTTPPQRTWVGLTDEEIDILWFEAKDEDNNIIKQFARAIEAAHGIKE